MAKAVLMVAAAFAIGLAALPASAQDVVDKQLDKANEVLGAKGYAPFGFDHKAVLGQGRETLYRVDLTAGSSYYFSGACDHDCEDLDLQIIDAAGNRVASDTAEDDVPIVSFVPEASGGYTVRMVMAACKADPCSFGVRGFVRR